MLYSPRYQPAALQGSLGRRAGLHEWQIDVNLLTAFLDDPGNRAVAGTWLFSTLRLGAGCFMGWAAPTTAQLFSGIVVMDNCFMEGPRLQPPSYFYQRFGGRVRLLLVVDCLAA